MESAIQMPGERADPASDVAPNTLLLKPAAVPTVQFAKQESGLIRDLEKAMLSNILSEVSIQSVPLNSSTPSSGKLIEDANNDPQVEELNAKVTFYKMRGSADADEARDLIHRLQFAMLDFQEQARAAKEQNALRIKDLEEQLEAKNEIIDAQRVLIQRYEFAVAEASVFLSRPLHEFQVACEQSGINISVSGSQVGDEAKVYEKDPTKARAPLDLEFVKNISSYVGTSSSQQRAANRSGEKLFELTDFEIKCMQSIRLAYLYTKVVQNIMQQVSTKGLAITKHLPRLNAEGASEASVNMNNHAKVIPSFNNVLGNASLTLEAQDAQFATFGHREVSENVGVTLKSRQHARHMSAGPKLGQGSGLQREKLWNLPATRSRQPTAEATAIDKRLNLSAKFLTKRLLEVDVTESAKLSSTSLQSGQSPFAAVSSLSANKASEDSVPPSTDSKELSLSSVSGELYGTKFIEGKCANCHRLMLQLDRERDHLTALKKTVTEHESLAEKAKAVAEKFRIENDMVNAQLEDLTGELFNQANILVADESRMRYALEKQAKELQLKTLDWKNRCARREADWKLQFEATEQARRRMFAAEYARQLIIEKYVDAEAQREILCNPMMNPDYSVLDASPEATSGVVSIFHSKFPSALNTKEQQALLKIVKPMGITSLSSTPLAPNVLPVVFVDGLPFSEFQDHLRMLIKEGNNQPTVNHATAFMKRCLLEDVETCLFSASEPLESRQTVLGNANNGVPGFLLFKSGNSGTQMATSMKKRIVEAVSKGGCEIQSNGSRKAVQQNILQANNVDGKFACVEKRKCLLCANDRECDFKLRFLNPPSDWNPCCRFCKDRVVAVCEFYGYLLQLRQSGITAELAAALTSEPTSLTSTDFPNTGVPQRLAKEGLVLFRHVQWLRRRMAAARIGSNGMFDSEAVLKVTTSPKCPVVVGSEANSKEVSSEWQSWCSVIN